MQPKLGIIAGGGDLPKLVIEACRESGRAFYVVALDDHLDFSLDDDVPHGIHRMNRAGDILDALSEQNVAEVVMAGRVRRPALKDVMMDRRSAALLLKIGGLALGDDRLLRGVSRVFEDHGFRVIGADQIVDDLLAPRGILGRHEPDSRALADIEIGIAAARQLGAQDLGQAVIVRAGEILDTEDEAGTAALVARCAPVDGTRSGVLVKMFKPGQDRRIDLPTIGPDTITEISRAGLEGVAVEAGRSLILKRLEVIRQADHRGVFVLGVAPEADT